jgi:uncharacterized protein (TIGR02466 family)
LAIENWFSVPILFHDLEQNELKLVQTEIEHALPNIMKEDLSNPWEDTVQTTFNYNVPHPDIIQEKNLSNLKNVILNQALNFCSAYNIKHNLKIKESWINICNKGGFQFEHQHLPFFLSGVYYYSTNGNDGDIQFSTPNPWLDRNVYPFGHDKISYQPTVGRIIIFPSYLSHLVKTNNTDSIRISFSFNIEVHK